MEDKILQAVKRLQFYRGKLRSFHGDSIWEPGKVMGATCYHKGWWIFKHTPPAQFCKCGIWSATDLVALREAIPYLTPIIYHGGAITVVVTLTLWGKIIPYEHGYRSQFAEITGIMRADCTSWNTNPEDVIERIARLYGVPVV